MNKAGASQQDQRASSNESIAHNRGFRGKFRRFFDPEHPGFRGTVGRFLDPEHSGFRGRFGKFLDPENNRGFRERVRELFSHNKPKNSPNQRDTSSSTSTEPFPRLSSASFGLFTSAVSLNPQSASIYHNSTTENKAILPPNPDRTHLKGTQLRRHSH